jgi:hypothetical protein
LHEAVGALDCDTPKELTLHPNDRPSRVDAYASIEQRKTRKTSDKESDRFPISLSDVDAVISRLSHHCGGDRKGGSSMKITELRKKAQTAGVNANGMKKPELIHAIQASEGNDQCFGTSRGADCPHTDCCFMSDCTKLQQK